VDEKRVEDGGWRVEDSYSRRSVYSPPSIFYPPPCQPANKSETEYKGETDQSHSADNAVDAVHPFGGDDVEPAEGGPEGDFAVAENIEKVAEADGVRVIVEVDFVEAGLEEIAI
jgi:hypothetical protein